MSKRIREQRRALLPIRHIIGKPQPFTWTGHLKFKRERAEQFVLLSQILRSNEFESWCAVVGFIESNWAVMEQQLTWITKLVFSQLGGNSIENEAPVTSFSRRSTFLRKAFNQIGDLAPYRDDALSILGRADDLAETRNDLTHAVITHLESKRGRYELQRLKIDKQANHELVEIVFEVTRFPRLSRDLVALAADAIELSRSLMARFLTAR